MVLRKEKKNCPQNKQQTNKNKKPHTSRPVFYETTLITMTTHDHSIKQTSRMGGGGGGGGGV